MFSGIPALIFKHFLLMTLMLKCKMSITIDSFKPTCSSTPYTMYVLKEESQLRYLSFDNGSYIAFKKGKALNKGY